MRHGYKIGPFTFRTKTEAEERCSKAVNGGHVGSRLQGEDAELAQAILKLRGDKMAQINGREITGFVRRYNAFGTHCLYVEFADGSRLDFSFKKVTKALTKSVDRDG